MQTQFLIFLALLIIVVIVIILKSSPTKHTVNSNSILKNDKKKNEKHVQFATSNNQEYTYDLRKGAISNDIEVNDTTRQAPSGDLLSMYTPAREEVPTDEVPLFHKGREQLPPLRCNK